MYNDFGSWLTDIEVFKLGITLGFFIGLLSFFIITAVVEYTVDLFNKKRNKSNDK